MRGLLTLFLICCFINVEAQANCKNNKDTKFSGHVRIFNEDLKKIQKLIRVYPELTLDYEDERGIEVYGPAEMLPVLDVWNIHYLIIDDQRLCQELAEYPSPEETNSKLFSLAAQNPNLITVTEIGKSTEGRPLLVARITASPQDSSLPEFKYIANMHGNEIVGREMMLMLIEDLASHYYSDARIRSLLNTTHIYIMPSMNPDGAANKSRWNAHEKDLNRNFPDFTTADHENSTKGREAEVQALMNFQAQHHFKLSANFHGGTAVVNYPWDAQPGRFPEYDRIVQLSLAYASSVPDMANSIKFPGGVTNGYKWYPVRGGMQDWSYHWYGDLQVTIELFKVKWPDPNLITPLYNLHRESLIRYIEAVHQI